MFSNIANPALVVSGQYGGPVLVYDKTTVTIYTCSGEQISSWKWNNGPAVAAGWSEAEDVIFVLEDGTVLTYSMFGIFHSSFSMGQEAKDGVLSAKIFSSHKGTGVAVLTSAYRFWMVTSLEEVSPRLWKMYDTGELPHPNAWCPLTVNNQSRLVVGRGTELVLLSVDTMDVLEVEVVKLGKVVSVTASHSQNKLCVVLETGLVWLGTMSRTLLTHELSNIPRMVAWCGEDAVVLIMGEEMECTLLHQSGDSTTDFQFNPLCIVQECDGVRIIVPGNHDLIHKVDRNVQEIFDYQLYRMVDSKDYGAKLLMASEALAQKSHKADEYIRMIGDMLNVAVSKCIAAAGAVYHHESEHQKKLMRAAKFGSAYLKTGIVTNEFKQQCETLRLLNNIRFYKVGIPLTYLQLEALSRQVLLDRLIARRLFPLALEISEFLNLPSTEGRSRVLGHWAMFKVDVM